VSSPSVDVVVATYNRQERLVRTLRSLERQTVPGFGVVVVDDGSNPPAEESIPPALRDALNIRVLRTPGNRGPAAARNMAIQSSSADVIAFLDDDVDADPGWLDAHLERLRQSAHDTVIIGPLLAPHDWRPTPWNRWEAVKLAHEYARMEAGDYAPTWRQFFTGTASVRRSVVLQAGGFNETLRRAEDIELALRLSRAGSSFVFAPEARGWHYARRSRGAWLGNAAQYAAVDVALDAMYPELRWLELIADELGQRSRVSRLARWLSVGLLGEGRAVGAAVNVAILSNRGPLAPLAVKVASLAYDIRYRAALESLTGSIGGAALFEERSPGAP
jgi:GT2 family glycosyltransferase